MNWISAKDRLPDDGQLTLICIQTNDQKVVDVMRYMSGGRWLYFGRDPITHWMPLLEPPEEE